MMLIDQHPTRRASWCASCPRDARVRTPAGWNSITNKEQYRGSARNQGTPGGRRPFRPPDAPLEPQDARRFIFQWRRRDGIYIIDLLKTTRLLDQASEFAGTVGHGGGTVLFVATKKQARDAVRDVAEGAGMPYVVTTAGSAVC